MDSQYDETKAEAQDCSPKVEVLNSVQTDIQLDIAGQYLAKIAQLPDAANLLAPWTPEEEKAVQRKADLIVVPLLTGALVLGATDKVAISTAAVLGLRTDLHLVGQQYSWSSSLIFFGSLLSLFPALLMMQRYQSCRVLSLNVAALNLIVGSWYTRKEQVVRVAIIFSTMSSLINGVISYGCSFLPSSSGLKPWQLQFILLGVLTSSWGMLMFFFLPDSPISARFLSTRERTIGVLRLREERTGVQNKVFKRSHLTETLLDPKTYLFFLISICLSIPNSGVNTFNSIIIASFGFTTRQTVLMSIPVGMISWLGALVLSWVAVKTRQRCLTTIGACIIPLLSTVLLHVIPRENKSASLGVLFMLYLYWPSYLLMMTTAMANTAGYTKKLLVYGIGYYGYLIGGIVGPQTFKTNQAPAYTGGITAMLASYCIAIFYPAQPL
ncbi:hypothetical protein N7453_004767 [Penicillium expansum]|nr:hypothetical protein N7453_004767 [Penicillium expansum]